jgi:hypothetical protein
MRIQGFPAVASIRAGCIHRWRSPRALPSATSRELLVVEVEPGFELPEDGRELVAERFLTDSPAGICLLGEKRLQRIGLLALGVRHGDHLLPS